ncbi:MAG: Protein translocase subunit SecA, preprotein translocase subunit SecA, partial [Parcubacteria group bacterium]|nr:Protein translocase subunit SecA, preprotein translocase subunit SecA [Parcubacteria group bacterium]
MPGFLNKMFAQNQSAAFLKGAASVVALANAAAAELETLSQEALQARLEEVRARTNGTPTKDEDIASVFALVREASRRTLKERHYDVQLMGALALARGKIAEMRTGEGKTLVATLAVTLRALAGKGVHVVTVNDYLARRDGAWMGQIYGYLGLTLGVVTSGGSYIYDPSHVPESEDEAR